MSQRKQWDKGNMRETVTAVKNKEMVSFVFWTKTSLEGIENICCTEVDIKGLRNPLEGIQKFLDIPLGRKQILPLELKDKLLEYWMIMKSSCYSSNDLKRIACKVAIRNDIASLFQKIKRVQEKMVASLFQETPSFKLNKTTPYVSGKDWGILKRHCR